MAPEGISFFVYADVCELSYVCNKNEIYMLLDTKPQDHGPSLGILPPFRILVISANFRSLEVLDTLKSYNFPLQASHSSE